MSFFFCMNRVFFFVTCFCILIFISFAHIEAEKNLRTPAIVFDTTILTVQKCLFGMQLCMPWIFNLWLTNERQWNVYTFYLLWWIIVKRKKSTAVAPTVTATIIFFITKTHTKKTTIVRLIQTQYFCMFCLDAVAKVNCLPPCICSFFCGRKWGFIVFWFLLFSYACAYWRFWRKKNKWCRMQTVWFVK